MTLVVGHRGALAYRPENTMPSFELAVEQGVDAIELDVHLTSDGQLAVIHDPTLDRTTDRSGAVAAMTMREVKRADAGARFSAEDGSHPFEGLEVPTLKEVLSWLPAGIGLVVELKSADAAQATVDELRGSTVRRDGAVTVISFEEAAIERIKELDPELPTGLLLVPYDRVDRGLTWAAEHDHLAVFPWDGDLGLDPMPVISQAAAFGRRLGCYVVNEPDRVRHLAALGLWGFVTDVPDLARAAVGPRASEGFASG
jgi:glycerophosphoryl diester phosphodiesterase